MTDYDFICDQCADSVITNTFSDDGEVHGVVDKTVNCNGHLHRVFSFGIGAVPGGGGSPGRVSQSPRSND